MKISCHFLNVYACAYVCASTPCRHRHFYQDVGPVVGSTFWTVSLMKMEEQLNNTSTHAYRRPPLYLHGSGGNRLYPREASRGSTWPLQQGPLKRRKKTLPGLHHINQLSIHFSHSYKLVSLGTLLLSSLILRCFSPAVLSAAVYVCVWYLMKDTCVNVMGYHFSPWRGSN